MSKSKDNKKVWDRYAKIYDYEITRFNGKAYGEMYRLISHTLTKDMRVLEIATGTGLIAINVAEYAHSIEAIDFSQKMIDAAKRKDVPSNVNFSVEDATNLSFSNQSFDAVIISNALHIMPEPEVVLLNIKRVLKCGGILIAPTYSQAHIKDSSWNLSALLLKLIGFETHSKWSPTEYVEFINENGFIVEKTKVLKAAFPLVYLEAKKE